MIQVLELLICPRCKLKTALQRSFGKRGFCFNCKHDWNLKWKGSKSFSKQMRLENA